MMFKWLAAKLLRRQLNKLDKEEGVMKGWKTWAGGIGLILTGLGMIATGVVNDLDLAKIQEGIALVGAGLVAIGLGHKIDRTIPK